jgi:HAD superfamily hydrolase (TIGR01509 family)
MTLPAAVLFDMDGLLVDTEPVWTVAEVELARQLGGEFTPELKASIVGTRLEVAVPTILDWYGGLRDDATVSRTMTWLLDRMVELFAEPPVVLPGVTDLITALASAGVPTALVSSSYRVLVDAVLAHGIGPFDLTLAGDEVTHGKPHPEPYLTAATRLGVDPTRCVVLEDSPAGVASAEDAGCAVVAVPSVHGVGFEGAARRLVVPTLEGVTLGDLTTLLDRAA